MANILVTGGAGFIGSHLVSALLARSHSVRVIDNFATGNHANLREVEPVIELVEGDICDRNLLSKAMQSIDYVLHHAAIPSVPRSIDNPLATNQANITGTLTVLQCARERNVRRVVYASSSSVYGDTEVLPKHENMQPNPLSPYALTKLVGEHYCRLFTTLYGLETVSLRYFNVFGARQDPTSTYAAVIPRFITKLLRGEAPIVYGDGEQTRDFTYVANVVDANLLACEAQISAPLVCNIGCNARISLNELVTELNNHLGTAIQPTHTPPRPGDVKHSLADITIAKNALGYQARYSVAQGLAETLAWYQANLT